MKLHNGFSPNGKRVAIFLMEKGLDLPTVSYDVVNGETRTPAFLKLNPMGAVPALELDDGEVLTETVAICRYLEALHPTPALFGATPLETARIEMWMRRLELGVMASLGDMGLHTIPFFAYRITQNADYAASLKPRLDAQWAWLDDQWADGREFAAGEAFSMADVIGMSAVMITTFIDAPIPETLENVQRWKAAVTARPSWGALASPT